MDFLVKLLSSNSTGKDRAKDVEEFHRAFADNQDSLKRAIEKEGSEVRALMDLIFDSSFREEQVFMKSPSLAKLKFNQEFVSRVLSALKSQDVPVMSLMLDVIQKHGMDPISDAVIAVLEMLAPGLESKVVLEFTTDDVVDAMDLEWHSSSNKASPLLTALASITNSPRLSAASAGESPFHPPLLFRRSFSDRSSFPQPESFSKTAADVAAPRDLQTDKAAPKFSHSCSDKPSRAKPLEKLETVRNVASYHLTLTTQGEEVSEKRRKSLSFRELLAEDSDLSLSVSKEDTRGIVETNRKFTPRGSLELSSGSSTSKRRSGSPVSSDLSSANLKSSSSGRSSTPIEQPNRVIIFDETKRDLASDFTGVEHSKQLLGSKFSSTSDISLQPTSANDSCGSSSEDSSDQHLSVSADESDCKKVKLANKSDSVSSHRSLLHPIVDNCDLEIPDSNQSLQSSSRSSSDSCLRHKGVGIHAGGSPLDESFQESAALKAAVTVEEIFVQFLFRVPESGICSEKGLEPSMDEASNLALQKEDYCQKLERDTSDVHNGKNLRGIASATGNSGLQDVHAFGREDFKAEPITDSAKMDSPSGAVQRSTQCEIENRDPLDPEADLMDAAVRKEIQTQEYHYGEVASKCSNKSGIPINERDEETKTEKLPSVKDGTDDGCFHAWLSLIFPGKFHTRQRSNPQARKPKTCRTKSSAGSSKREPEKFVNKVRHCFGCAKPSTKH